jgi:hypothetical protein
VSRPRPAGGDERSTRGWEGTRRRGREPRTSTGALGFSDREPRLRLAHPCGCGDGDEEASRSGRGRGGVEALSRSRYSREQRWVRWTQRGLRRPNFWPFGDHGRVAHPRRRGPRHPREEGVSHVETLAEVPTRGGPRKGSGRKPKVPGARPNVVHRARPSIREACRSTLRCAVRRGYRASAASACMAC